ncbi:MAG: hypothetical protein ACJAWW_002726, partial [Sulfurimonas sp.]
MLISTSSYKEEQGKKKMINKKLIVALLISAATLFGADFKEGVNYKTLDAPLVGVEKGTVVKVFSFTCP